MKFKLGDIVQPDNRKAGIIVDVCEDHCDVEYAIADGKTNLVVWIHEDELKKLSGGIKGEMVLGTFVKNVLHNKGGRDK